MNGVVSASMRGQGIAYKLNFGVSLPKIKEIASYYPKDAALAGYLWEQDVREFKILATLLQPWESFTKEQAERWVAGIRYQEIAEQYCKNLMQHLPFAQEIAADWIFCDKEYTAVCGFLLYASFYTKDVQSSLSDDVFIVRARSVMDAGVSRVQRAAMIALKRYGRRDAARAGKVLEAIADYAVSDSPEKQEFFNDIKFEFDYYH